MAVSRVVSPLFHRLVSRRGAWATLALAALVSVVLFGALGSASAPGNGPSAPADSESAQAAQVLAEFPNADRKAVLIVATRDDGEPLTAADTDALGAVGPALEEQTGHAPSAPVISDDNKAALIMVPIVAGTDDTENADVIEDLRTVIADQSPPGLSLLVTGGPAFGADVAAAFDGADFTLLMVTILIVAVLLILTYRSPVLWLVPLAVVGLADQAANTVTAALGDAFVWYFDSGIVSVLVFGAGTNYALLFISRYREELRTHTDHRAALVAAWQRTLPAVVASNVTVVLALLTLVLAVIPGTRGLGTAAAVGLLIALAAVVLVLPAALAVCGRGVFWPFIPRAGTEVREGRAWRALASRVIRRPIPVLLSGLVVLAVMGTGLLGTSVGLAQADKFRVPSESAAGLEVLSAHFDPGKAQPLLVVTKTGAADDVVQAARGVDTVARVQKDGTTADGELTRIKVTGTYAPGTPQSLDLVRDLREQVHAVPGADALVGGAIATDLDARAGNHHDLVLIAPLVLAVSFLVLLVLLRSLVAPVLLLVVNLASSAAAIGLGSWLSRIVLGQEALDLQVPLLAFLFLVALGIDYTIFLVQRARTEATNHGTRTGMVEAVAHTGAVITSAGIVLAGVFAALGLLPLVTLGQLGLIVGAGVLVDTLLVRTVIVPALFGLFGDRIWWPGRVRGSTGGSTDGTDHAEQPAH